MLDYQRYDVALVATSMGSRYRNELDIMVLL